MRSGVISNNFAILAEESDKDGDVEGRTGAQTGGARVSLRDLHIFNCIPEKTLYTIQ